ncbi:NAD(P)/FAD-dependent oxidoreductase [Amycolatopsis jejuensis]|uniref:NAD(P)/FAD-dependent oxidoreductase n=1 Tax=Amycolatopsis jejuensis TaxID=330084 RepID=UPI0005240EE4|nr:FAD-dependent oxidoreductase [Amycolatopsis jejuensis]
MRSYDVLIIGGGIAGVSLAYELAADRAVGVLEREPALAAHATGRSAATFVESLGDGQIRGLTRASRVFYESPPLPFGQQLLRPMALLLTAVPGRAEVLQRMQAEIRIGSPDVRLVDDKEVRELNPLLRPGYAELALFEPDAMEIDVHAVHQGYVQGLRQRNGIIRTRAKVVSLVRRGPVWTVTDAAGESYEAPVVVNAAGAWVDGVARLAGAAPIGVRPLRRTIFLVSGPGDVTGVPLTADVDEEFYFKPEGGHLLCSPADETPMAPCDARPDEVAIARGLDAINEATVLNVRHVRNSWAGLRSFAPDGHPVVGFDERADGLFWFAGQGGFGVQTAPALARLGAAVLRGEAVPADVAAAGVSLDLVGAGRFAVAG